MTGPGILLPDGRERKRVMQLEIQVGDQPDQKFSAMLPEPSDVTQLQSDTSAKLQMGILYQLQITNQMLLQIGNMLNALVQAQLGTLDNKPTNPERGRIHNTSNTSKHPNVAKRR